MKNFLIKTLAGLIIGFFTSLSANASLVEIWQSSTALLNISDADTLIGSRNADYVVDHSGVIDFDDLGDGSDPAMYSDVNYEWPGGVTTDFAARITGTLESAADYAWSLFAYHDDGVRVSVNGTEIFEYAGLTDNRLSGSHFNANFLTGTNFVEIIFFEHAGGASLEFFAEENGHAGPSSISGLETVAAPVPEPSTILLFGIGVIGVVVGRRLKK